jgi:hypothetical protein
MFRRGRDRDVRAEVEFHLAMRQQDLERAGMASEAARIAAPAPIRQRDAVHGEDARHVEVSLDRKRGRGYPVRAAKPGRTPGFSIVAVLVLAIGIGANAAMFSLVDAMLLRGLPYGDANRLVILIGNVQRQTVERRATPCRTISTGASRRRRSTRWRRTTRSL